MNGLQQSPTSERLSAMLLLTALLHGILLLGITFSPGRAGKVTPGMEVLLVSEELPEAADNPEARYAAQRTQLGSGNTLTRATSSPERAMRQPPPAGTDLPTGENAALHTSAPQPVIRFEGTDDELPERAPAGQPTEGAASASAARGAGDELVLRGDPHTGQWLNPGTRAWQLAPYLDGWRRKIERLGTLNYPSIARSAGFSGAPVIEVAVRSDGVLEEARLQQSSGQPELDRAALGILRQASPFNPFPPALARQYRILRFAYQWEFVDGRLSTGSVTPHTDGTDSP